MGHFDSFTLNSVKTRDGRHFSNELLLIFLFTGPNPLLIRAFAPLEISFFITDLMWILIEVIVYICWLKLAFPFGKLLKRIKIVVVYIKANFLRLSIVIVAAPHW